MPNFLTDYGWAGAEIIKEVAYAYVAITNTRAAINIAEMQRGIAQGQLDLSAEIPNSSAPLVSGR